MLYFIVPVVGTLFVIIMAFMAPYSPPPDPPEGWTYDETAHRVAVEELLGTSVRDWPALRDHVAAQCTKNRQGFQSWAAEFGDFSEMYPGVPVWKDHRIARLGVRYQCPEYLVDWDEVWIRSEQTASPSD